jgi:hypothetical protein
MFFAVHHLTSLCVQIFRQRGKISFLILLFSSYLTIVQAQPALPREFPLIVPGDFTKLAQNPLSEVELGKLEAWLLHGNTPYAAKLKALHPEYAMLLYEALAPIKPEVVLIKDQTNKNKAVLIKYDVAPTLKQHRLTFFDRNFQKLCPTTCPEVGLSDIAAQLVPVEGIADINVTGLSVVTLAKDFVIIEFTAPIEYRAKALVVTNKKTKASLLARTLPGPRPVKGQPYVSFSMVDQETVKRNFGERISGRYYVIDLQIKNPGLRKIQFKRSAIWFEVDYVTAKNQKPESAFRWGYNGEYDKDVADGDNAIPYRFGLDHQYQQHPEDFLSILGAFDSIAGKKQTFFYIAETLVGVAAGLSGGIIGGRQYPRAIALLSGTGMTGYKNIFLNEEIEKRKRTHLFAQSFQEIIQIAPQSSEATKVFIPRRILLGQSQQYVVVQQVRDVHLELEVVTDSLNDNLTKGEVEIGSTVDQVQQVLGLPDTITGTTEKTWSYVSGSYKSVQFNAEGKVIAIEERSLVEQLRQGEGNLSAGEVKKLLGLSFDPDSMPLVDGGEVWLKPPGLTLNLRFNDRRILTNVGYETVFEQIKKLELKTRSELEAKLVELAFPAIKAQVKSDIEAFTTKDTVYYTSPDLQGSYLVVKYDTSQNISSINESSVRVN